MDTPRPVASEAVPVSSTSRLTVVLLVAAAVMALVAGGLLWASQGEAVFAAWIIAAIAGCF